MEKLDAITNQIISMTLMYGPKLLLALVTLFVGLWIIKLIIKACEKAMDRANIDPTLKPFLISLLSILFKLILIISVASMIGVELTSLIAVLGAAGLAIGLALQGSLANFAGGTLILIFKPFKVGDVITAAGHTGKVDKIQIFNTILVTPDNQKVIIPNATMSNNSLVNVTALPTRRVDRTIGIAYEDDIDKARQVIQTVVNQNDKILKEPKTDIFISELGDNSVNFVVRAWCQTSHYWDVYFYIQEACKKAFDENQISIPFPQRDVHIINPKPTV